MSRFTNDVDAVGEMLNNTVVQIISSVINVIGTFCLMVYTNIWLTLITVLMVPVMMQAARFVTMLEPADFIRPSRRRWDAERIY